MAHAQGLRRVALADMLSEPGFEQLVLGVLEYAEHAEHWRFAGQPFWPFLKISEINGDAIDGVIGNFHEEPWVEAIRATGVPAVDTSASFAESPLPRVTSDDRAVGRLGAEHLLERGFAEFGFVPLRNRWFSQQRLEGFCEVIERAGRRCHVAPEVAFGGRAHHQATGVWLQSVPKPIGVMTVVDHFGTWVIGLAKEQGLRVPEDVAVLAVNNDLRATAMTRPPMSSIQLDFRQIGYRAARLLDDLMARRKRVTPRRVPPLRLVARRSTDVTLSDDLLVVKALRYIREHSTQGITTDDVAGHVDVSRRNLELRMKRAVGQSPHEAINRMRIEHAKRMLASSHVTVQQVASACGFPMAIRFNEVFKRVTGVTPGAYRRQIAG